MNCRSCGQPTEHVLSLGEMPLANRLLDYPSESYKKYPLDLMFCPSCKLGQLKEQVDPDLMFSEYVYYSSVNQPVVDAAKELVEGLLKANIEELEKGEDFLVVEIGSNDGYLLQFYSGLVPILGIEPARGPANAAALKGLVSGIPVIQDYFTLKLAKTLPKADIIHAHNVLAHVQDLNDVVAGIAEMLKGDGVCVVEVPDFGKLLEKAYFDQIYAEHNYYFTVKATHELFLRHGMQLRKWEPIPAHGGSLRLFFEHGKDVMFWEEEYLPGRDLFERVNQIAGSFYQFVCSTKATVWGFGAAAKATMMLNYCGVDNACVTYICDDTPAKWGKFIPGTGQKIVPVERWLEAQPEWTCIFAWNYEKEIREKYKDSYKGQFFTPYNLPTLKGATP